MSEPGDEKTEAPDNLGPRFPSGEDGFVVTLVSFTILRLAVFFSYHVASEGVAQPTRAK